MQPDAGPVRPGHPRQRQGLHRQDRKDAGHQVQDQPGQQGKQDSLRQRERVRGRRRCRPGPRFDRQETLLPGRIPDHQHARQPCIGLESLAGGQMQREPVIRRGELLRSGVVHHAGRLREEHGFPDCALRQPGSVDRQGAIGRDRDSKGRGAGRPGVGRGEERRFLRGGGSPLRQVQLETALLRHANLFADQPVRLQSDGQVPVHGRARIDGQRQQHLPVVAEDGQRTFRNARRRGPDD